MWGVELTVMAAMVLLNGIFAAYEIALATASIARLQALAGERRYGAAAALQMKRDMEGSLAAVQLGITLVGAIAAATGGAGAEEALAPALLAAGLGPTLAEFTAIALVVVPLTAFTIVLGELVPKLFGLRHKEWVCLALSPLIRWLALCVWPIVWSLETSATKLTDWAERLYRPRLHANVSDEALELQDLRAVASVARASRLIGAREENIILGAAKLSSRPIREIMLPAEEISMLNANDSISQCLIAAHLDMHTRFPVTERAGDAQGIIGYVNFKDIIVQMRLSPQDSSLRGIVRTIPTLAASSPISSALETLMRFRTHIAVVRDAAERVVGMITLEDIIEELVGDIQDEYDLLPAHAVVSGQGWVVGGGISLARLKELTGIDLAVDLPTVGARNLSNWVVGHLGEPVSGGEVVERKGVRAIVRKVRRAQVLEAQLHQQRPGASDGGSLPHVPPRQSDSSAPGAHTTG
ncbi:MAG: hemolysin family protein [Pirellulales bacterium]